MMGAFLMLQVLDQPKLHYSCLQKVAWLCLKVTYNI